MKKESSREKYTPRIKICGLTKADEALLCAELGANAIGLVFYKRSPRYVADAQAYDICRILPKEIKRVGVFVNEPYSSIMHKIEKFGIDIVQLHGNEPPQIVTVLRKEGIAVIKALFLEEKPDFKEAADYEASAFLVECGKGSLPGGTALSWSWEKAKSLGEKYPLILAGGLSPENVSTAVSLCLPDAVDVSSGVESSPGIKDIEKVKSFINKVSACSLTKKPWRIF